MRRFFRLVFVLLDLVLLVLFGIGYLSGILPLGAPWWMELVAIGLPYLGMALVPVTAGLLLARRRWLAALHGVLLLLFVLRVVGFSRLFGPEAGPDDLTVLTYNVHTPRHAGGSLDSLVASVAPDVVCLQEINVEYHPRAPLVRPAQALRPLLERHGYTVGSADVEGAVYTFEPVLARIPIEDVRVRTLPPHPGDGNRIRLTRAVLRWKNRPFVLYNVHLQSFGHRQPWREADPPVLDPRYWVRYLRRYGRAFRERAWEAERIREVLEQETLPVMMCGDFNSTPHNRAFRYLARGLQDGFRDAGRGWGMTYHRRLPLVRIDHVLGGTAWQPVSARVLSWSLSDHLPVVTRWRWRPEP